MSDEQPGTPPPADSNQPPNWGSAYPPPPPAQPHPGLPPYSAHQPPPGQQPYPGQRPYAYPSHVPPKHPQATTSMVLGIVALAGGVFCWLPIFLAPVAWIMGHKSVKEIDANPTAYSGRSEASAGRILGIIGTVLIVLGVVAFIAFFSLVAGTWTFSEY